MSADSYLFFDDQSAFKADLALVNAGVVKYPLPRSGGESNVTWGDIVTSYPYKNDLVVQSMTELEILEMLAHSVRHNSSPRHSLRAIP